jgi:hypothetical protein
MTDSWLSSGHFKKGASPSAQAVFILHSSFVGNSEAPLAFCLHLRTESVIEKSGVLRPGRDSFVRLDCIGDLPVGSGFGFHASKRMNEFGWFRNV